MTPNSPSDSSSIFKDGKLKPGVYKIQNLYTGTYLDIHQHSKQVCCRPAQDLDNGGGLWEIESSGVGYTVKRVEPGKPEQFCTPIEGLDNGALLHVTAYSVAWRVGIINDEIHRGFEYVRFYWGPTTKTWDLDCGIKDNGNKVQIWNWRGVAWQGWKLIPVKAWGVCAPPQPRPRTPGSGSLPSYDGDETGQSSTRTQHVESERDEFGTVVDEVTVVTTNSTVTTRKRYRVEDA